MNSLKTHETIHYINMLDPAIAWPKGKKKREALEDQYADTLDTGLLTLEGEPLKWELRPLTPNQVTWVYQQSMERGSSEISDSLFFHYALAGVVGIADAPHDMPPPGFIRDGRRIQFLDPEWLDSISAPYDYVCNLGVAVARLSSRDNEAEKNSFCLSVKRR